MKPVVPVTIFVVALICLFLLYQNTGLGIRDWGLVQDETARDTSASRNSDNKTSADPVACLRLDDNGGHDMIWIEGGRFSMGSSAFYPEESPQIEIDVDGFFMDRHEVTNRQFEKFIQATGYITVAERQPTPGDHPHIPPQMMKPGSLVFVAPTNITSTADTAQWWQFVEGASWRRPLGPDSALAGKEDYPVVHIAYEDALTYARWIGHELPTEAQWEYAALGGTQTPGHHSPRHANTWQGMFPLYNKKQDGYAGVAPAGCFPANGYGLYDMIGNVWEWVSDWYYPGHRFSTGTNSNGYDPRQPGIPVKVIKGGSYLCAKNYCMRYRPSARHAQEMTLGAAHIGFRTVINVVNNNSPALGMMDWGEEKSCTTISRL